MATHYIGLISGTSMDGIDAVVATFGDTSTELHATLGHPYPAQLRSKLAHAVANPDDCTVDDIGELDAWVGECFRNAALAVMQRAGISAADVSAIGSHGQTIRHQPDAERPFSLQIGDPSAIAQGTGIMTVADFRRADIAAGGQGAPLVPPFHEWLFARDDKNRVVLNLGGIANITILGAGKSAVTGFDTGPGNTLLDHWSEMHRQEPFDSGGKWAAAGAVIDELLETLLSYGYFERQPPKSTGLEEFNLEWLTQRDVSDYDPQDVQATLCELTARTVADDIAQYAPKTEELFVCGGGAHNDELMRRLGHHLPDTTVNSTAAVGLDPDWVEAAAFAWLAMRRINEQPGNLPSVTGASRKTVLGALHSP